MSEDSDQEKTEEPTSKRLEDARKKGQIARSREFNTFVMLMTSAVLLLSMGRQMANGLLELMRSQFQISRAVIFDPTSPILHLKQAMMEGVTLIAPFVAVMVVAAIIAPLALGGWVFSWSAIEPKFSKLNPIAGIARMFAVHGLIGALAGVILASRMTSGQPMIGQGFELTVISACVLGGVSLSGGIGMIRHVIAGVLILAIIENAMNLKNIDTFYQYVIRGSILLLAVVIDRMKQR